jgi:hypothetical protein
MCRQLRCLLVSLVLFAAFHEPLCLPSCAADPTITESMAPTKIADILDKAWAALPGLKIVFTLEWAREPENGSVAFYGPSERGPCVSIAQGKLFYYEVHPGADLTIVERFAFDGSKYYAGHGRERKYLSRPDAPVMSSLVITFDPTLDGYGFYFDCLAQPAHEGRGLIATFHQRLLAIQKGLATPEVGSRPYSIPVALKRGQYRTIGMTAIEGSRCLQIEGPGDRLWLDADHGFALRRRELDWEPNASRQLEIDAQDYAFIRDGIWIPRKIRRRHFAAPIAGKPVPREPRVSFVLQLTAFELGPFSPQHFRVQPEPGTRVSDNTLEKGPDGKYFPVAYTHANSTLDTEKNLEQGIEMSKLAVSNAQRANRSKSTRVYLLALNVAALIVLCVIVLRRYYRNLRPRNNNV